MQKSIIVKEDSSNQLYLILGLNTSLLSSAVDSLDEYSTIVVTFLAMIMWHVVQLKDINITSYPEQVAMCMSHALAENISI